MALRAGVINQTQQTTVRRQRRNWLPYMLALPILLYEGIFILIPIIQEVLTSFASDVFGGGPIKFVGLANYQRLINDAKFWSSLRITLVFMLFIVIVAVGVGLVTALLLNQTYRGRSLIRGVITLPWAFPDVP